MRINFKLLSSFLAVAKHASFRKAADELHLSLPAVSMQIKQLEERLDVALFQRTTRRVELTREGEELRISTCKALAELDGVLDRIQQTANVQHGHLSFACVPTLAGTRLPALLVEFARRFPAISVRVRELAQPALLEAVRRREVDFGIGPQSDGSGDLTFKPIFDDDYVALLPTSQGDGYKNGISLREISKMPLMTISASEFQRQLHEALQQEALVPELHYDFAHVSTMTAMVEAGLGVAVIPAVRGTP